jgi:hypothetical protein
VSGPLLDRIDIQVEAWEKHLCAARVSEEIEVWYRNAEKGC